MTLLEMLKQVGGMPENISSPELSESANKMVTHINAQWREYLDGVEIDKTEMERTIKDILINEIWECEQDDEEWKERHGNKKAWTVLAQALSQTNILKRSAD